MNGLSSSSSPSTLRFRHNTARLSDIHNDMGDVQLKRSASIKRRTAKETGFSQGVSDGRSSNDNTDKTKETSDPKVNKKKPRRDEITNPRLSKETYWSLRYLILITVILVVLVVGGLIYLAYLIMLVHPDSQYHLLDLQKYISSNQNITSRWHSKWLNLSKEEEDFVPAMTEEKDDTSTFTFDASETDLGGEIDSDLEGIALPSPSRYTIPNSIAHVGDKSEEYARLRQNWEEQYPPNSPERSLRAVEELLAGGNGLHSVYSRLQPPPIKNDGSLATDKQQENYDIYNCPDDPPMDYPREYKTLDILKHWPPMQSLPVGSNLSHHSNNTAQKNIDEGIGSDSDSDSDTAPVIAHLGLCVFDYRHDREKAIRYRSQEMPFVVRNDPSVAETVERWNNDSYRRKLFGTLSHSSRSLIVNRDDNDNDVKDNVENPKMVYHRAERSITNQVLYRQARKKKPPKTNRYPTPESNKKEKKLTKKSPKEEPINGDQSPPVPPPTRLVAMTYDQWYEHAMAKQSNSTIDTETGIQYYDANINREKGSYYYYFRLIGCGEKDVCERNSTEYLFDEMPFFQPTGQPKPKPLMKHTKSRNRKRQRHRGLVSESMPSRSNQESLYLVDSDKQRGIHCRFGMPGMIAANHYDASRNAIAVLGGSRRYILSRPSQCPNLGLYPLGHPSARHSMVDWTTAVEDHQNLANHFDGNNEGSKLESISFSKSGAPSWDEYQKALSLLANKATSTEVILQAGDVLYLPSYWFHYIISLNTNMQCNTRSGRDDRDTKIMADCGFPHK